MAAVQLKIFQNDGQCRFISVPFQVTTKQLIGLCCAKIGLQGYERYFRILENNRIDDAIANRLIGDEEQIARLSQGWLASGITDQQARFIFAMTECDEKAILARAQMRGTGSQNVYRAVAAAPDISNYLSNNPFYFGAFDDISCVEELTKRPDGSFLLRIGADKNCVMISHVSGQVVYHLPVRFDAQGFYTAVQSQRYQTIEELYRHLVSIGFPLIKPVPLKVADKKVQFASKIRQFPCFYGEIGSQKATQLLSTQKNGTFLIRTSSKKGCFATSYKTESGVSHSLVLLSEEGFSTPGDNHFYPTLDAFIDASQTMFFGLPRAATAIDDAVVTRLGLREGTCEEVVVGMANASTNWQ